MLRVLLPGHDEHPVSARVGGKWGVGTMLGFDDQRRLIELVLDLSPASNVTLIDAPWSRIIRGELARATAAVARLSDRHTTERRAHVERTLLSGALDLAVLLFYPCPAPPAPDALCGLEELDLFEVARGVWIGVHPEARRLGAVVVDRVGERQWVQGWSTDAPDATAALNALHRAYYGRPTVEEWRRGRARSEAALPAHLSADAGFIEAWRQLADVYEHELRLDE